jgi:N-acetyl-alpha-D-glucosaminyl L-malate synthase BshA
MRIGIICYPTYGGSGVLATELARFLARRGHSVHVISSQMPFRLADRDADLVKFHEVHSFSYPLFGSELYTLSLCSKVIQVASDEGIEVVHAHYAIPHAVSGWMAREALGGSGISFRLVTTLHGTDATLVGRAPSFYPIVRFALRQSDAITVPSQWLARETVSQFQPTLPVEVVPNFVDTETFKPGIQPCRRSRYAPNGERILLHVSNFRPVKRTADVIRVFDRVRRRIPSKLLMVGDGPDYDTTLGLARELGLHDDVIFLGKQSRVDTVFGCADLLVFPSEYESFGLAAIEAGAAEIPVVASNGGGLPETVIHGETGYLANVGDVDAMAEYAIRILDDDTLLARMRKAARRVVVEKYRPEIVVPQYERIYERVLGVADWSV